MIAKEWRDARWKLLLGVLVFLVLVPTVRSYEAIRDDVRFQVRMMQQDLRGEGEMGAPPMGERERDLYLADIREMRSPEYVEDMARWELRDTATYRNLLVVVPLAGLFGIGLIAGEVGRGSVFLLLSKPVGRTRILVTKYAVSAACLAIVAAVGGTSIILTAHARGYPAGTVDAASILTVTGLTYLGSLFVLGVALTASVIFRDVLRTLLATVAVMFAILAGPDLFRAALDWLVWGDRVYAMDPIDFPRWYEAIEHFRLVNYWTGVQPYFGEMMLGRNLAVCAVTATAALLLALWMFRRKAY